METRPHHLGLIGLRSFKRYVSDAVSSLSEPYEDSGEALIDFAEYQTEENDDYNLWAEDAVPPVAYQIIQLLLQSKEPHITDLSAWVSAAISRYGLCSHLVTPVDTEAVVEFLLMSTEL